MAANKDGLRGPVFPDWRPIKTAPKDGRVILLTDGQFMVCARFEEGAWLVAWNHDKFGDETHWMSLPPFPTEA